MFELYRFINIKYHNIRYFIPFRGLLVYTSPRCVSHTFFVGACFPCSLRLEFEFNPLHNFIQVAKCRRKRCRSPSLVKMISSIEENCKRTCAHRLRLRSSEKNPVIDLLEKLQGNHRCALKRQNSSVFIEITWKTY